MDSELLTKREVRYLVNYDACSKPRSLPAMFFLRLLNIIAIGFEVYVIYSLNNEKLLTQQTLLFHLVCMIWSILYNASSTIGTHVIFRFFANIFCTIFIMLAIFNLLVFAYSNSETERAAYVVLLVLMTGPTSVTSFTLVLLMKYGTLILLDFVFALSYL